MENLNALVRHVDELDGEDRVLAVAYTDCAAQIRVNKFGGGRIQFVWDGLNFKEIYRDEYTGEVLPTDLTRAALEETLSDLNKHV